MLLFNRGRVASAKPPSPMEDATWTGGKQYWGYLRQGR